MIPKVMQDAPNIMPYYTCSVCSEPLKMCDPFSGKPWNFCHVCGSPIEWDKAGPPVMTEYTILVTYEDGSTSTKSIIGSRRRAETQFPIGGTVWRGGQQMMVTDSKIVSEREFTEQGG